MIATVICFGFDCGSGPMMCVYVRTVCIDARTFSTHTHTHTHTHYPLTIYLQPANPTKPNQTNLRRRHHHQAFMRDRLVHVLQIISEKTDRLTRGHNRTVAFIMA